MRLLVCGGRDFNDADLVNRVLTKVHAKRPITLLINGGAKGADTLAAQWAHKNQIPYLTHPAQWNTHGKSAGPKRNQAMLETWNPQGCVAFPGGSGTQHMITLCERAEVKVMKVV